MFNTVSVVYSMSYRKVIMTIINPYDIHIFKLDFLSISS